MRSPDRVSSSSPAELLAAHTQPTHAAGEPAARHAEADPPQLHRRAGLRPGPDGPVLHQRARLPQRLPRQLGERGGAAETHGGARGGRAAGRRAPQTGPDHLHRHVPAALPAGAAHRLLHQLPAAELFLRLHAI